MTEFPIEVLQAALGPPRPDQLPPAPMDLTPLIEELRKLAAVTSLVANAPRRAL